MEDKVVSGVNDGYTYGNKGNDRLFKDYQKVLIDVSIDTNKTIATNTIRSYTDMYKKLNVLHAKYINDKLNLDKKYFKRLEELSKGAEYTPLKMGSYITKANSDFDKVGESLVSRITGGIIKEAPGVAKKTSIQFSKYLTPVFKELGDILVSGLRNYMNAYEHSFTELAGRTGAGYQGTRSLYSAGIRTVYNRGASSAVSISSDMIPAMQTASKQGFTGEALINKAFNDSIAKYIMPWLDTASSSFAALTFSLSEYQMKSLKSSQLQLQQTESGNRLLQTGVINTLTQEMTPLLTTLTIESSEGLKNQIYDITEQLMKQPGMQEGQAQAIATQMVRAQLNPYSTITSGSIGDRLFINAIGQGKDMYTAYNESYGKGVAYTQNAQNMFGKGAIANVWGLSSLYGSEYATWAMGTPYVSPSGNITGGPEALNLAERIAAQYKTITERLTTWLENLSAPLGQLATAIPFAGVILSQLLRLFGDGKLLSSIGSIAKGVGSIGKFGLTALPKTMLGGAKGLISGAQGGAGLASWAGLGTVGQGLFGVAGGVGGGISGAVGGLSSAWAGLGTIPQAAIVAAVLAMVLGKDGLKNIASSAMNGIKTMFSDISNIFHDETKTLPEKVTGILGSVLGTVLGILSNAIMELGNAILEKVGSFGSFVVDLAKSLAIGGTTPSEVFEEYFGDWGNMFGSFGESFSSSFNASWNQDLDQSGWTAVKRGYDAHGSHAGGLSYVPRDNYLAQLHIGERVLTRAENAEYTRAITTNNALAVEHNEQLIATVREVGAAIVSAINGTGLSAHDAQTIARQAIDKNIVSLSSNVLNNSKLTESR